MSKRFLIISLLTIGMVLFAACGGAAPADEATSAETPAEAAESTAEDEWGYITVPAGEKVVLGLSSALSAGYAAYGQDMLNGVTVAVQDFGDLNGWEIAVEGGDDQCEGAPGVTVAEQFSSNPYLLGVVGPMCSGTVVPAMDVYGENHVLMITPSSTAIPVTAAGYQNVFRIVANDDLQAQVAVDYLFNELGMTSLAIVHDQSIYGEGIAQAVQTKFEASGGTVTGFEGITRGDQDFSAVVSTILEADPDAIYWGGMDAEGALLVNQLRAAGFEGVFFGPDGIKSVPSFVEASGGAAEGAYMTFGAVGGATGYEEFEAKFKEQFGDPIAYGPGSYDAAMIMLNAAKAVATVDSDGNLVIPKKALADMVRATPYDGITGHLEFDEKGDLKVVSLTVFQAQGDELVPLKVYNFGE
ncbi:MAG: branched-chain amino acid ABC transporter substrate-binding protein [Anaerolineaceae bacterium]|jgi:branched-chain amino acid transport system substrate-binding protein|nr:MAG: branched-chain amino acid ABC transporter substrate-binding protein [Anaerolineaceae bacterium]